MSVQNNQLPLGLPIVNPVASTPAAATAIMSATTTYPFSYTTYSNTSPAPFTKPTIMPTGIFSFGPVMQCSANSAAPSASAMPSNGPLDLPTGQKATCVISNAMEVSDHAFWDMYSCCQGRNITGLGKPLPCSAQCIIDPSSGSKQTWQEVGECLSKRVQIVVCKPDSAEIGSVKPAASSSSAAASNSASSNAAAASSGTRAASPTGNSPAASSSVATAAASQVGVVHASFSKVGVFVFALVAVSSAAGMFL